MSTDQTNNVDRSARVSERNNDERRAEQSFREVLQKSERQQKQIGARPPAGRPVALKQGQVAQGAAIASSENLGQARSAMNADASRMVKARAEGQLAQEQKVEGRVLELIVKELAAGFARGDPASHRSGAGPGEASLREDPRNPSPNPSSGHEVAGAQHASGSQAQAAAADPALKAQAAVELVERIEAFVKANRPALSLTVGGGIDARVEVERTGKNEVALKVIGKRGPPAPDDLARIREALRERGLRLSHLSVG